MTGETCYKAAKYNRVSARGGGGGGEGVPVMAYTGRLRPKGVPFPRFRYKKG